MKKYNTYYPAVRASKTKKIRKKPSFSFLKPILLFVIFVAICAGTYVLAKKTYHAVAASQLGTWTPSTATVSGADGTLAKELYAAVEEKLNKPFSTRDAVQLQRQLVRAYPQLRHVSVKRGLLTSKVKVTVKRRVPVAQFYVSDGSIRFIDEDGSIYEDKKPDPLRTISTVAFKGTIPTQLNQELVDLIESTLKLKSQLEYASLQFDLTNNTVEMVLPDQCKIYFGQAKNLRQKARRAAQIEELARETAPHPHVLDFTYFDDGKVFLRQVSR